MASRALLLGAAACMRSAELTLYPPRLLPRLRRLQRRLPLPDARHAQRGSQRLTPGLCRWATCCCNVGRAVEELFPTQLVSRQRSGLLRSVLAVPPACLVPAPHHSTCRLLQLSRTTCTATCDTSRPASSHTSRVRAEWAERSKAVHASGVCVAPPNNRGARCLVIQHAVLGLGCRHSSICPPGGAGPPHTPADFVEEWRERVEEELEAAQQAQQTAVQEPAAAAGAAAEPGSADEATVKAAAEVAVLARYPFGFQAMLAPKARTRGIGGRCGCTAGVACA